MSLCHCFVCFFFKQKTAYEMRISDWSSDVCSSDLQLLRPGRADHQRAVAVAVPVAGDAFGDVLVERATANVQVLELNGAGIGCVAQDHHAPVGAVEERLHRVAAQVGIGGDSVGGVAVEGVGRAEESVVGTGCASPCKFRRWATYLKKK